jgi:hypothetical protein
LFFLALLAFAFYCLNLGRNNLLVLIDHCQNAGHVRVAPENLFYFILSGIEFIDPLHNFLALELCLFICNDSKENLTDHPKMLQRVIIRTQNIQIGIKRLNKPLTKTIVNTLGLCLNQLAQQ